MEAVVDKPRRFSGTHITVMVVAISLAVVGAPVAVAASTGSFVNITDPVTAAYKARVTPKGSLAVTPRDAVSGYSAKVDALGRQLVTGPVTVGGKVTVMPALPALPFSNVSESNGTTVPAGKHLVVETVSVLLYLPSGNKVGAFLRYKTGGVAARMFLPVTYQYSDSSNDLYFATTTVRLYADPGSQVFVEANSPSGVGVGTQCTVSGYLI